jgi:hypothetical protein
MSSRLPKAPIAAPGNGVTVEGGKITRCDRAPPTKVSIDWIRDAVDDEVGYQLETVVSFTGKPAN